MLGIQFGSSCFCFESNLGHHNLAQDSNLDHPYIAKVSNLVHHDLIQDSNLRLKGYKTFSMLNSAQHEIYPAKNVKMPAIVVILTFISMIR